MKHTLSHRLQRSLLILSLLGAQSAADAETFTQVYQRALSFDPKTKSAQLQAQSAQTLVRQAKAGLYPQLDFNAGYSKNRYEYNPKYADQTLDQGLYRLGIQLNQSLYDPRIYAGIKVQKSQSQLRQLQYRYQALYLAQDSLQAYLDLIRSQARLKLLKSDVALKQSKLQKVQKQFQLHLSSEVDRLQAQVDLDNAQIELKKQQNLTQTYRLKLKKFIGEAPIHPAHIRLDDPEALPKVQAMQTFIDQHAQQLEYNPQLQYAQASITAAQAKIQQAKSDYWPKLNFTASYQHYATNTPNNQNSYDNVTSLGVNISLPLYAGGQTQAQVAGNRLQKQAAEQDLLETQNSLKVQWQQAKAQFDNAVNLLPMYQHAMQAAQLYQQAQQKKYQKGLASIVEVKDAQNKYEETQFKYLDNLITLTQAYLTLLVASNQLQGLKLADTLLHP